MEGRSVRPLGPDTWDAYAALIERHKGIWGGCWCLAYHGDRKGGTYDERREKKRRLVGAGQSHAALVFDADACIGWAQFGRIRELPEVPSRKAYEAGDGASEGSGAKDGAGTAPDWRIPCFFVATGHRRQGVARSALAGALDLIAAAGGGTVEAFPETTAVRKATSSFLWHGTLGMFEGAGFAPVRQIGKHRWVVRRKVEGAIQ